MNFINRVKEWENLSKRDNEAEFRNKHCGQILKAIGWELKKLWQTVQHKQLSNFKLQEVELGIGSSMNEICRMEWRGLQWIFKGNRAKTKKIWWKSYFILFVFFESFFLLEMMWKLWKNVLYQLEIDMDPRYVRLPKCSWDSLSHQGCLTACILGLYPSLHDTGKTANYLATNDNSLVFFSMASYFTVPMVLLTMSFRDMPKYLPLLSG